MKISWQILRQRTFPPEFRIDPTGEEDWSASFVAAISEATAKAKPLEPPRPALDEDFAVALCNQHFRLRRNAEQIVAETGESKELRSIQRALQSLSDVFERYGIECRDLTGQAYDFLRLDFEQIGEPEIVAGLDGAKIWRCERPIVVVDGKLIQKARGIVARPA
ncbi:MAG TPA: hypothetical protein VF173_10675 [Thermoanaerobaculia bacterium]|nr:hypothetical protein [Thermoanaerobaculia bacterium]